MQLYNKKSFVGVVIKTLIFPWLNNVLYEETKYARGSHDAYQIFSFCRMKTGKNPFGR